MIKKQSFAILFLVLVLLVTSGCSLSFSQTPTPEPPALVITVPPEPSKPPILVTTQASPDPTITPNTPVCPVPASGQLLFTLDESANPFGLCFLYPDDFVAKKTLLPDTYLVSGTPYGTGELLAGSMELSFAPAGGQSLQQFAQTTLDAAAPGMNLVLTPMEKSGVVFGYTVEGIPGMVGTRTLFLLQNDTAFTLTFMPTDTIPQAVTDMERLYALVSSSWVWLR